MAGDVGARLFRQDGDYAGWYTIESVGGGKATLIASVGTVVLYGTSSVGRNYRRPNGLNTVVGISASATPTGIVWGVDYSQQAAAFLTYTDMVIGADTAQFTSVANPAGPNIVGNIINVTSGTGFTVQRVQVTAFTAAGLIATVDKSLGTTLSTGGNGTLGGAVGTSATLGALAVAGKVAGNHIYVKATGTYTLVATTTVTASEKGDITNGKITVEGYTSYRGQLDGRPIITTATNSIALITVNDNDYWDFVHLKVTSTAATKAGAFSAVTSTSTPLRFIDIICDGPLSLVSGTAFGTVALIGVEVTNATSAASAVFNNAGSGGTLAMYVCDIHDNTCDGVRTGNVNLTIFLVNNIFDTNTIGFNLNWTSGIGSATIRGNVFVDNTGDGIQLDATSGAAISLELVNNIIYGNGGEGIDQNDDQAAVDALTRIIRNNAFGSNSGGNYSGMKGGLGEIALTADPFTNKASRDFSLNNTAGGGAACRAAGFPGAFVSGTTTSYADVGAAQHQDSGGGGPTFGPAGGFPSFSGVMQ